MVRTTTIIVDTGPLIATTNKRDQYHRWAQKRAKTLSLPFLTCEAVLSEAWFLLRGFPAEQEKMLRLIEKKAILVDFDLSAEISQVTELLRRYRNVPMSLADACLVRMSELHADCLVFSTDTDFNIYRRRGDQIIPALLPAST
jgi:predicted nucleic acid-binding protein